MVVLICISLVTFEVEHVRKDFYTGHGNIPLGDYTLKALEKEFERGGGCECHGLKAPPDFSISDHILKQQVGLSGDTSVISEEIQGYH